MSIQDHDNSQKRVQQTVLGVSFAEFRLSDTGICTGPPWPKSTVSSSRNDYTNIDDTGLVKVTYGYAEYGPIIQEPNHCTQTRALRLLASRQRWPLRTASASIQYRPALTVGHSQGADEPDRGTLRCNESRQREQPYPSSRRVLTTTTVRGKAW